MGLPQRGFGIIGHPLDQKQNPGSIVDGQFSMPFSAAVAFRQRGFVWDDYAKNLTNLATLNLCKKVAVYVDDQAEACSPENMSAKVRITANGQTFETFVQVPMGEPDNFMSAEQFHEKFSGLCSPYLTAPQRDHLSDSIMALEACTDLNAALFG